MNPATITLLSVAKELARQAKSSLPELAEGERVVREQFEDGVYTRETVLGGKTILNQYDFRQKSIRRMVEGERGVWQRLT